MTPRALASCDGGKSRLLRSDSVMFQGKITPDSISKSDSVTVVVSKFSTAQGLYNHSGLILLLIGYLGIVSFMIEAISSL